MSVKSLRVNVSNTQLLVAAGETAVLTIIFSNTTTNDRVVSLHVVKSGNSVSDVNKVITELTIAAKDSYVWSGMEKFVLDAGDYISAITDAADSVSAILSYKAI